ncbi:MAG: ribose-phosphate pyrophosphokinase [bacterium]|nr:ribose-phosphate pyrophosphokinase [bacterium]
MFKLFSGSANPKLSDEVSKLLHIPLSKSETVRFGNSEVKVTIQEEVKNTTCAIIQPIANPSDTNLMELFFFCDALRRQEAKKVIAYIPHFGYARQDIQHRSGECVSANVIIRFFESIGFSKIYTIDIHDEATQGVFSIPYKNLSSMHLLANQVNTYLKNKHIAQKDIVVVSPDQGGIERTRDFGEFFFRNTNFKEVVIEKKRDHDKIHQSKAVDLYGNVQGKTAILVDDILTSGGTLLNAADVCLDRGAKNVLAAIVHHDFTTSAPQKIMNSKLEKIFSTNTILLKSDQKISKLEEISVAPIIADEIKNYL